MKGRFTKFKLLCFLFISIFILGFGGEIKAVMTVNSVDWLGDYSTARYAKFNVTLDGVTRWAYCLDAPLEAAGSGYNLGNFTPTYISEDQKLRMINVLVAAGYPNYNLGLSDLDSYYVTQAALWYARYGSNATWRTFTPNFHLKMYNGL